MARFAITVEVDADTLGNAAQRVEAMVIDVPQKFYTHRAGEALDETWKNVRMAASALRVGRPTVTGGKVIKDRD